MLRYVINTTLFNSDSLNIPQTKSSAKTNQSQSEQRCRPPSSSWSFQIFYTENCWDVVEGENRVEHSSSETYSKARYILYCWLQRLYYIDPPFHGSHLSLWHTEPAGPRSEPYKVSVDGNCYMETHLGLSHRYQHHDGQDHVCLPHLCRSQYQLQVAADNFITSVIFS